MIVRIRNLFKILCGTLYCGKLYNKTIFFFCFSYKLQNMYNTKAS